MKRLLLTLSIASAMLLANAPASANHDDDDRDRGRVKFELVEATIPQIRKAMQTNVLSAERLTRMYMKRIDAYEAAGPGINAYLHINENALREARQLDALNDHHHGRPRPRAWSHGSTGRSSGTSGCSRHRSPCTLPRRVRWRRAG